MSQSQSELLTFTERGIYCQKAGVFIDPRRSVPKAIITHAHSDHACAGCQAYLSTPITAALLKHRLGHHINVQTLDFDKSLRLNGVVFSFHPAGHISGSAQIRVESEGEVWVVSGDYKRHGDGVSAPFEPVNCDTFITESTFALPVYHWPDPYEVYSEINTWWSHNAEEKIPTFLTAYSLGKAQRLLQNIDHNIGPVYCHPAVAAINETLNNAGVILKSANTLQESTKRQDLVNAMVILPSSALRSQWTDIVADHATGAASGWMMLRGRKRWQNLDRGFIVSDHADWPGLNATVRETGCQRVIVTHGYKDIFARWLNSQGYQARAEDGVYEGNTE